MQSWSPSYRNNAITLEKDTVRFTGMLPGLEGLKYSERLDRMGIFTLEIRGREALLK